jgi:RHS repeat-associated protein
MADYNFHSLLVSLNIIDTPVGYRPPVGPGVDFTLTYNQRDAFQPQVFSYSNVGHQWTFDWLSYIEDNPSNLTQSVTAYRRGGGRETYSGFNSGSQSYAPHMTSRAVVVRTSVSPIRYERRLPDGSVEVFAQSDGAASPRRVFMTDSRTPQWTSPSGATDPNAVRYYYEGTQWGLRLVSVKDGIDQVTTLSYENASDPMKITKVTDPFGRFATLEYNVAGQLESITDVIGIQSSFAYGPGDFVNALTTPYGTTRFRFGQAGTQRWLEAEDPLGAVERVEFRHNAFGIPLNEPAAPAGVTVINQWLEFRNSFYWDKRAMALYPGNYSKARITHFLHGTDVNVASGVVESTKAPLEGRIWYTYPGQNQGPQYIGSHAQPTAIARVLDDGTTQVYRYEYNSRGFATKEIDPLGRETRFTYGTGSTPDPDQTNGTGRDLLKVEQKSGSDYELLTVYAYNAQHLPLTITDSSGQTTTYTYNTAGQGLTITTPLRAGMTENRTTAFSYDTNGYLQSVTAPMAGASRSYTYDGFGRVRTVTADNSILTYDYDVLDRRTKITYPDGTYEETVYNRLDPEQRRDSLGRWTRTFFDALRRVVAIRDSLGQTSTLQWCTCGSLEKLFGANSNATTWERDLQGRVTREVRSVGAAWEYTYETTTSRLKQRKDAKNQLTSYEYFLDDNQKQITYTNAPVATPNVSFTYEPVYNRLATMIDGTGVTTYTYGSISVPPALGAGKLASVDGPLTSDTLNYTYDELGRVASRGLVGFVSSFNYDALGRLTTQTSPVGGFTQTYDGPTFRRLSLSYPNGQATEQTYFPVSGDHRLQQIKHLAPGGAMISKYDYAYAAVGMITTWSQQVGANPAKVYSLGYDAMDQIVTAKVTGPTPLPVPSRFAYAYDAAGNRTAEQLDDAATGATYNSRHQLTSRQPGGALLLRGTLSEAATVTVGGKPGQVALDNSFVGQGQVPSGTSNVVVSATDPSGNARTNTYQVTESGSTIGYTYDANGNLTGDGTRTFEWDAEDRLTAVKQGTTTLASFVYGGDGRRRQKVTGGVTRTYVYDGPNIVEERLSSGQIYQYMQGPGVDRPLAQKDNSGAVSYYLADHLGSVVQVTNSAGAIALTREYDPWGDPLQGAAVGGYAYTGREWDPEIGLYYYRARYYDPKLGRFLSEDPLGAAGGINRYTYVGNEPSDFVDPLGLQITTPIPNDPPETLFNCMGWALGGLRQNIAPCLNARDDPAWPSNFMPKRGCFPISCHTDVPCSQRRKVIVFVDEEQPWNWHVMLEECNKRYSSKNGTQPLVLNIPGPPIDYYKKEYNPPGKVRMTCWNCPLNPVPFYRCDQ